MRDEAWHLFYQQCRNNSNTIIEPERMLSVAYSPDGPIDRFDRRGRHGENLACGDR
jgi:hypothetical protein